MSQPNTITATIDSNEHAQSPDLKAELQAHRCVDTVTVDPLPAADIAMGSLGFERKQPEDYVASILDDRLEQQTRKLDDAYEQAYILYAGSLDMTDGNFWSDINGNAIRASMAALYVRDTGVDGIITGLNRETRLDIAVELCRKHATSTSGVFGPHVETPTLSDDIGTDTTTQMYACLPGVGPVLAQRMRDNYASMRALLDAETDELEQLDGIGPGRAHDIYTTLHNN